ncbi:MAG: Rrf2 family transcriptional regulator [Bacteroidetes bacterium]|nr:MAG: Rrf2 family transcriptional regulator [Bacteroidota bacterium]
MVLSKSFGYALRSILYMAAVQEEKKHIQLQEIAAQLDVPRHFLGKVMKRLSKQGIIDSTKGHAGGYALNENTLSTPVMAIVMLIEGEELFNTCVIGFKKCNEHNPCPLHHKVVATKNEMIEVFNKTKISDLLKDDKPAFIRSLVTA